MVGPGGTVMLHWWLPLAALSNSSHPPSSTKIVGLLLLLV